MTILHFKFKTLTLISVLTFIFYGCAHQSIGTNIDKYNRPNSEHGLIIGTVTFPRGIQFYNSYFFHLKYLGEQQSKNSVEVTIKNINHVNTPNASNNYSKTYIFAIVRKAGKYNLDRVRLFGSDYETMRHYEGMTKGFSIPFEVKKGEITYIGEITYDENQSLRDPQIDVKENFERDLEYFKRIGNRINWETAKKGPMTITRN